MTQHETIGGLLDAAVARWPRKDAYVIGSRRVTYGDLAASANALAKGLLSAGVRKGDRVAVWMGNGIEWLQTFHALARIGAVLVPLSTRFKADEAHYILGQCEAPFLILNATFAGIDFLALFDAAAPGLRETGRSASLPSLHTVLCAGAGGPLPPGVRDFARLQEDGRPVADETLAQARAQVGPADPFLIQYTSGTTGFPKGAVLTHGNFARTGHEVGVQQQLTPDTRFFSPAPAFHVSGTMHAFTAPLAHGSTVFSVEKYDLQTVLEVISANRCTVYHGFNFFKDFFARREEFAGRYDLSSLRYAWTTGTAVDMANIASLGIQPCSLYGLSETTGCSTICVPGESDELRTRTVGKPLPGIEICIHDRNGSGRRVEPGEEGEICIRGWNVMSGYHGKPQETAEAFDADGWFRSGDLGSLDTQGYVRFLGRLKDLIRVGGENLSPLEVENLLRRHEKVAEACVVGVPDERLGEVCMAFVQPRPGAELQAAEIVSFCREHIADYKVPRHVRIVEAFPMTGNNKIRRVEVKELARRTVGA